MECQKCSIEIVCSFQTDSMSFYTWNSNGKGRQTTIVNSNIQEAFDRGYSPPLTLPNRCIDSSEIYDAYMGWRFETKDGKG